MALTTHPPVWMMSLNRIFFFEVTPYIRMYMCTTAYRNKIMSDKLLYDSSFLLVFLYFDWSSGWATARRWTGCYWLQGNAVWNWGVLNKVKLFLIRYLIHQLTVTSATFMSISKSWALKISSLFEAPLELLPLSFFLF